LKTESRKQRMKSFSAIE